MGHCRHGSYVCFKWNVLPISLSAWEEFINNLGKHITEMHESFPYVIFWVNFKNFQQVLNGKDWKTFSKATLNFFLRISEKLILYELLKHRFICYICDETSGSLEESSANIYVKCLIGCLLPEKNLEILGNFILSYV